MKVNAGGILRPGWTLHVLPALIYALFAFGMGSIPGEPMAGWELNLKDKIMHALGFGVMQWTHLRAIRFIRPHLSSSTVVVFSVLTAILAGGLLEGWQFLLPHRTADLWDWFADAAGALLAGGVTWVLLLRRSPRPSAQGDPQ